MNNDNGENIGTLIESLKFTPELLLKFPADFKFMARGTALYDFKATDTRRTR